MYKGIIMAIIIVNKLVLKLFPLFYGNADMLFLSLQKPSLLQLVFSVYGRAPKAVKQVSSFFFFHISLGIDKNTV